MRLNLCRRDERWGPSVFSGYVEAMNIEDVIKEELALLYETMLYDNTYVHSANRAPAKEQKGANCVGLSHILYNKLAKVC